MDNVQHGIVKWFAANKGYGFIVSSSGGDVLVHHSTIPGESTGFKTLEKGDRVIFISEMTDKGERVKFMLAFTRGSDNV